MRVLRPNSVSTGWTDRQLDLRPQSPQPSHTRSLMTTRSTGVSTSRRLRLRRSSAAHSWSWMSTVTPGTAARASRACSIRSRCHTVALSASETCSYAAGFSVVMMTCLTPSAISSVVSASIGIAPTACCPPVIATTELYSSR